MTTPDKQTDRRSVSTADSPRVAYAVGLTRAGMVWEQAARGFWPLLVVLALVLAALAFGLLPLLSRSWLIAALVVAGLALVGAGLWGLWRFRRPSRMAARARVDAALDGRPLSALSDEMALGGEDAGATSLWQAHLARMRAEADRARPIAPDAGLARRDPFALRLAGLTALAMVLVFAPPGEIGQGLAALGSTFRPVPPETPTVETGPGWEGWAQPPAYTRRPTIYLNALPVDEALVLPKGSRVSFRLYGKDAEVSQDIGQAVAGERPDPLAPEFTAEKDGSIRVAGRRFAVTVQPDAAPTVSPGAAPSRRADGKLVQQFTAKDDNGVVSGRATISLDLAAVDRRFGLSIAPEKREDISIDLPLPATGPRKEIKGQLVADLARHPWANLPVTVRLEVTDGIDQTGQSAPMKMILPGRRFFDPLAASLIEMRRDLLWSRENRTTAAEILRAVTWQSDGFMDDKLAVGLEATIAKLESGPLSDKDRDAMAQMLWEAAIALEDGGLSDALARMRQAQERLSEAIRNGASPDEVQRLMDELRKATDAYTDMLAERGTDPSAKFDRSPKQQRQQITGDQIQKMMDEIQRLMNEGRMAEAQELLDQFNRMMENLQVNDSPDGNGARQRPMNRLAETLRDQQKLSDEIMRDLQDQFMQPLDQQGQSGQQDGQQGQQGEQGQPGQPQQGQSQQGQSQGQGQPGQPGAQQGEPQGGGSFADRQRQLREELGRQRGLMPGQGTAEGDQARQRLDDAGRAMEEAEQALRDGDAPGAMERQAEAIQNMREGMRALGDLANRNQQDQRAEGQNGQQGQEGDNPQGQSGDERGQRGLGLPYSRQAGTDPLGRQLSGQGNTMTNGDPLAEGVDPSRQARNLLDEIRRRMGERERPEDERDYLGRLLNRF
ncbi:DUF4175 domain-containing protein [Paracoccus aminophilus]|uniref:TIGR02302 family protein n=1 Tax=Paracoccus aminophilus JCM 7686 TaxID=1367847 RepID=S5XW74_PARAH|nr:DUF4175 domain-containing protein [Paracoccus aminophilus]AGT07630.1 hypothetical protein JCM7686_0521 [Paracoccus aminophilus JCM 7686]